MWEGVRGFEEGNLHLSELSESSSGATRGNRREMGVSGVRIVDEQNREMYAPREGRT